ncbi:hypothetical protein EDD85DRAFT_1029305 [Armillaria nabsnona]|nr:hypothetical protein EDD85DRAFT_1029305 [Armillaria nabsnona]
MSAAPSRSTIGEVAWILWKGARRERKVMIAPIFKAVLQHASSEQLGEVLHHHEQVPRRRIIIWRAGNIHRKAGLCLNEVQVTVVADFCPKATYRLPASWDTPPDHLQPTSQSLGDCGYIFLLRDDVSMSAELHRSSNFWLQSRRVDL